MSTNHSPVAPNAHIFTGSRASWENKLENSPPANISYRRLQDQPMSDR